jgi:5-methylcytosine-specific restriction enzyme subunit McrC
MKIPIQNVYYLLCYAWGHFGERDTVDVARLDRFERMHDLFGSILAQGTFRLVRSGIDRGYREVRADLPGIKGKLAVAEMAQRALQRQGRTACIFEELSHDVLHNQLLRATLRNLLYVQDIDPKVRTEVGLAFRKLEDVSIVHINRNAFRRVQLDRSRRAYRFLMAICELLHDSMLVSEDSGDVRFADFRDDDTRMWKLFEDFVLEFYRREQTAFAVSGQVSIPWSDASATDDVDLAHIPQMRADLLLESRDRRVILDTKYYKQALPENRFGQHKMVSGNLYQLLSYLRNRQVVFPTGPRHEGILLYPVVDYPVAVDVVLEGFRIQAIGIDLAQDWRETHVDLLAAIRNS